LAAINKLLSPFPQTTANGSADEVLRRYVEALTDYTLWDIETAVEAYLTGRAPGFDGRFAPTAPMLASACRRAMEERLDRENRARRMRPALPPPDVERTPASRARVKMAVNGFLKAQREITREETEMVERRRKERWNRAHVELGPDMSEDAMRRRLGYTLGNDAEEFAG